MSKWGAHDRLQGGRRSMRAGSDRERGMANTFRWYELQTTDTAAAEAFYTKVVGWKAEHMGPQPGGYTTFNTGKGGVAGMMTLGAGEGSPRWIGYIGVDDVDATADRVKAAGGSIRQPAIDVPGGMLRFAGVAHP